jgi:pimeloyl-ACP methyl ester carboxylesterase
MAQPGYVPPMIQPGYVPPTQPRKRTSALAIAGVALAALVLLAVILAGVTNGFGLRNTNGVSQTTPAPLSTAGSQPGTTPTAGIHPTSAFQSAPCPFPVGSGLTEGQQVSCGYVTVPENRAVSTSGQVKLAVAIFKAPKYMTTPDPAPVLRLDGGPGGPSLDSLAKYITADNYSTFIFDHDEILFDQRGTGYSTPSLKCPELIALQYSASDVSAPSYEQQASACHDRLVSQGIDLNGFNSLQNAADVNDLVHALGYQQMSIYGVSYGTRLALTVMRLFPGVVHAAILDSVYPTNHNRSDLPSDAQRVFDVLFQGCAKDPNCNAKYPNLKSVFYSLVDTLNAHPSSFQTTDATTNKPYTIPLSGNDLVSWLFSSFYVTPFIKLLPQTIFQIKAHNYTQLSYIYSVIGFDSTISDGFFYSVECSEDWPFLTQQDITKSVQGITPQIAAVFGTLDEQQEYAVCQNWKVQQVPSAQKQAVKSSLPTLVLSGEYDPITPPSNGQETANNLSHSYFFTFPGQGHGQEYSSDCSNSIINAFENDPSQQPSNACIAQMPEPVFA